MYLFAFYVYIFLSRELTMYDMFSNVTNTSSYWLYAKIVSLRCSLISLIYCFKYEYGNEYNDNEYNIYKTLQGFKFYKL